ncbi:hypothetical protein FHU41_002780 [Psychromicrobium silvestre]|uniref:Uncharacterized protein n=1 Tax=Psychromicrobium silvestre TaxID=1645614 RepID=A0A7Y9S8K1_9MICC|nr:hypothetical protein [Psychromicrobium silvestre]NYE96530.1 hypothetical protein [Psychromicrobium silvestre]
MDLQADGFRALCRSSPWKWRSLRFQLRYLPEAVDTPAVKGWLRRPLALRIESLDGTVLHSTAGINDSKDSLFTSGSRKPWLLPPHLVTPGYQSDGLVRRRPEAAYGEPGYGLDPAAAGRFSAWLDPVELAGNAPVPIEFPFANVADPGELTLVEHEGREALETVLSPNPSYQPRYPGSPILFPGQTAVRIDTGTGVCVASQSMDGPTAGQGHWLSILAVDEYMLDDLFTQESSMLTDVRQHIEWELPQAQ